MQKQYIAIYNCEKYSIQDIQDMVEVYNVKYWHRRKTWESPEEEDIDYKIDIKSDFDKAVKIACVEFDDDNDEFGHEVGFDEIQIKIYEEGYSWFEALQSIGWNTFTNVRYLEDFYNSEQEVRSCIENWTDSVAENNAWEVVKNGEAASW